jgi:entericidin B
MIKKILAPLMAAAFLATTLGTLSGCNTVEGAGKDVEAGGKAIKDEAREHKDRD